MLREAIQYIVSLSEPTIQNIGDQSYTDRDMKRVSYNPKADVIKMNTLSSLVDYIKSGVDDMKGEMIVHVTSPTEVALYSSLDDERIREQIVNVKAVVPDFSFDRYIDHEMFCINLQSKFIDDNKKSDLPLLLKFAGTVESGSVANYGDDGVTQKATVKTGIASKGDAIVPNPVHLKAYRTFIEVEQPMSDYVFRMRQDSVGGVQCALFEADGGAWRITAMKNIVKYLDDSLCGVDGFTVIS